MQILTHGDGPFIDMAISGHIVILAGITFDLQERQSGMQQVIDVKATGNIFDEGAGDHLVASLHLPPAEIDEDGQPKPINLNTVALTLWPYIIPNQQEQI
jgi:hypothetical protein